MPELKPVAAYPTTTFSVILLLGLCASFGSALAASAADPQSAVARKARLAAAPTSGNGTIFWDVDKNGAVTLSDRPDPMNARRPEQRIGQPLRQTQNPLSNLISGPELPVQGRGVGSIQSGSATFTPATDAASLARAQREREYWRDQADRFRVRQRDRERDLDETRRLRLLEAQDRDRGYYSVPIYARSAEYFAQRNAPYVAGFRTPSVYTSSPGAAAASGPASFIGSGFSSAGRR
jgi:hypothetical protein